MSEKLKPTTDKHDIKELEMKYKEIDSVMRLFVHYMRKFKDDIVILQKSYKDEIDRIKEQAND